ncbi:hypothetical protein V6N11_030687 [Hibiscus sabdariffa]|uniref:Uncharacterized protein n=1 Tax=Hibiscus sabdariffa TaxID=183260 RepID=A0ABR1ZPR4_9ROSI
MKTEVSPAIGWEEQQKKLEERMSNLKSRFDTNESYMEIIMGILTSKAEEASPESQQKNWKQASSSNQRDGKQHVEVSIIEEKERYSIKVDEPEILVKNFEFLNE